MKYDGTGAGVPGHTAMTEVVALEAKRRGGANGAAGSIPSGLTTSPPLLGSAAPAHVGRSAALVASRVHSCTNFWVMTISDGPVDCATCGEQTSTAHAQKRGWVAAEGRWACDNCLSTTTNPGSERDRLPPRA